MKWWELAVWMVVELYVHYSISGRCCTVLDGRAWRDMMGGRTDTSMCLDDLHRPGINARGRSWCKESEIGFAQTITWRMGEGRNARSNRIIIARHRDRNSLTCRTIPSASVRHTSPSSRIDSSSSRTIERRRADTSSHLPQPPQLLELLEQW